MKLKVSMMSTTCAYYMYCSLSSQIDTDAEHSDVYERDKSVGGDFKNVRACGCVAVVMSRVACLLGFISNSRINKLNREAAAASSRDAALDLHNTPPTFSQLPASYLFSHKF